MRGRNTDSNAPRQSHRKRRALWWLGGAAILAILAVVLLGRDISGQWARHQAANDLDAWAISDALHALDRADWLDPGDGNTALLRARCYRHLEQWDRRAESLKAADKQGAASRDLQNEITLGQIQSGQLSEGAENKLSELTAAGIAPDDIASSFIADRLAHQDMQRADMLLQAWGADFPDEPHVHYVRGLMALRGSDVGRAREEFEQTLALEPRHELALIAMARLYDEASQFDQALELYVRLAQRNPDNGNVLAGLAQVLRQLGRIDEAYQVLAPAMAQTNPASAVAVEAGQIELELAHYESALQWFLRCTGKEMTNHTTLSAAATALLMLGETVQAQRAYDWITDEVSAVTLMHDLRSRLELDPQNQEAAGEFQQLIQQLGTRSADVNPLEMALDQELYPLDSSPGMQLYAKHCIACHGDQGRGDGLAARHVFPRPRDLRNERMRLVRTRNGVPTRSDIIQAIQQGIPGTSMVPLPDLRDYELEQLADVVQQMRRDGVREQYTAALEAEGEEVFLEDVEEAVTLQTTPVDLVVAPSLPAATDQVLQAGQTLYISQACHSCHGETGVGDVATPLFDDLGRPAFPRDLVREVFKGGNTPQSIYLRLLLGMPGSPHPANVNLAADDMIALTLYTQLLGTEPKRQLTNHQREIQASSRPAVEF